MFDSAQITNEASLRIFHIGMVFESQERLVKVQRRGMKIVPSLKQLYKKKFKGKDKERQGC